MIPFDIGEVVRLHLRIVEERVRFERLRREAEKRLGSALGAMPMIMGRAVKACADYEASIARLKAILTSQILQPSSSIPLPPGSVFKNPAV
jgi:hypothetical protein